MIRKCSQIFYRNSWNDFESNQSSKWQSLIWLTACSHYSKEVTQCQKFIKSFLIFPSHANGTIIKRVSAGIVHSKVTAVHKLIVATHVLATEGIGAEAFAICVSTTEVGIPFGLWLDDLSWNIKSNIRWKVFQELIFINSQKSILQNCVIVEAEDGSKVIAVAMSKIITSFIFSCLLST